MINLSKIDSVIGKQLFEDQDFTDITLVCSDLKMVGGHRAVLSAASPFFRKLLLESVHQNTFLYMAGFRLEELEVVLAWVYLGTCRVEQEEVARVLEVATSLGIQDLALALAGQEGGEQLYKNETRNEKEALESDTCDELEINSGEQLKGYLGVSITGVQNKAECSENFENIENSCDEGVVEIDSFDNFENIEHNLDEVGVNKFENISDEGVVQIEVNSRFPLSHLLDSFGDFDKIENIDNSCDEEVVEIGSFDNLENSELTEDQLTKSVGQSESEADLPVIPVKVDENETLGKIKEETKEKGDANQSQNSTRMSFNRAPIITMPSKNARGMYQCPSCEKEKKDKYKMRDHIVVKHQGFTFNCDKCESKFSSTDTLRNHVINDHGVANFECNTCGKGFLSLKLFENHKTTKVSCSKCNFETCTKTLLEKEHMNTHDPLYKDGEFHCTKCNYSNILLRKTRRHIIDQHDRENFFGCDTCDYKTNAKSSLKQHKLSHEGIEYQCEQCDFVTNRIRWLDKHRRNRHSDETIKCDLCDYEHPTERGIKWHKAGKHEGRKYNCDECDYVSIYPLNRHKRVRHKKIAKKCPECDYSTILGDHLKNHVDAVHKGVRYKCDDCDYVSRSKSSLRVHKRLTHLGHGVMCHLCDFRSLSNARLQEHLARHDKNKINEIEEFVKEKVEKVPRKTKTGCAGVDCCRKNISSN